MSKYQIPFLTACIQAFGRRFSMTRQAAFRYLHEHKGLAFLIEFYDVEHLQSMDETIDDVLIICKKNGDTRMILYHGTNADIEKIDLEKGLRHKDFGKGFYLTPDKNTAIRLCHVPVP